METVTFNDEKYLYDLTIGDYQDNLEFIPEKEYSLPFDLINFIKITNDLYSPFPLIEISIKDPESSIVNKFRPNGISGIKFFLKYSKNTEKLENLYHFFIIDDIEITNEGPNDTTYLISCSSIYKRFWNNNSWYSTGSDNFLPATKIIENILSKYKNFPFEIDINLDQTDNQLTYITPVNWTLKDNIDYLLQYSVSENKGFYFLNYNLLKNKMNLISITQNFKNDDLLYNWNGTKLSSKYGFADAYEGLPHNTLENNFIKGSGLVNNLKDIDINYFDYKTRTWKKKENTYNQYKGYFPKSEQLLLPTRLLFRDSIPSYFFENSDSKIEENQNGFRNLGEKYWKMFQYMNALELTVQGYIERDVSQIFAISVDNFVSPKFNKYVGKWFISRIVHNFSKNQYLQELSLIRSEEIDTSDQNERIIDEQ